MAIMTNYPVLIAFDSSQIHQLLWDLASCDDVLDRPRRAEIKITERTDPIIHGATGWMFLEKYEQMMGKKTKMVNIS